MKRVTKAIELTPERFLHRSTLIIGATASGKTYIVEDILYMLRNLINQVTVFCPTDAIKGMYSSARTVRIPDTAIISTITVEKLEKIWNRQEALVAHWKEVNNHDVIDSLFMQVANEKQRNIISGIKTKYEENIKNMQNERGNASIVDQNQMKEIYLEQVLKIKKVVIKENHDKFNTGHLSPAQVMSLNNLDFNPALCIIFDDVTEELKKLKTNNVIGSMFTRGRHSQITCIFAVHTDMAIANSIRLSPFNTIFADRVTPMQYILRPDNKFDKEQKMKMQQAIKETWEGIDKKVYPRLLRDKEDDAYYYTFRTEIHEVFRFPENQAFWDFCNDVRIKGTPVSSSNPYTSRFKY